MAFTRPTLSELVSRVQADLVSRLELSGAPLRRTMVAVLARVVAGSAHMLHGHLEFLGAQLFPDTSEDEFLVRQAALFGIVKTAPTFAVLTVRFTGTPLTLVPALTRLRSSAGLEYETLADGTLDPDVDVACTAMLAGADSNAPAGAVLSLESPIAGVDSTAEVIEQVDGTDAETTEALRARLLARIAEPPMGGTAADYVAWAKALAGVTRVWVTPLGLGPGTVVVRFARDNDFSPIPDSGEVAALQSWIDARKPAHATVTVIAPVSAPLALSLEISPNTYAIQTAVTAQLANALARTAAPGATTLLSSLHTAISSTPGLTDYTIASPVTDTTHTANQLPVLGTITWL